MLKPFSYRSFVLLPFLLIPAIAMQFTQEVQWSIGDFFAMGFLLFLLGTAINTVRLKTNARSERIKWGLLFLFVFVLLWAEMAVGLFGSPIAGS